MQSQEQRGAPTPLELRVTVFFLIFTEKIRIDKHMFGYYNQSQLAIQPSFWRMKARSLY